MDFTRHISWQDKEGGVRAELNCCSPCGHILALECWSSIIEYKMSSKPSSREKSLELLDSDNTSVKKVKTCMKHLPSRQPRNTVLAFTEECNACIRNATCKKYEDENSQDYLMAEKEQERKLKQYKSCKVQPFASEQVDKNQEDTFVEYYLDTALKDNLIPYSFFQYPQNELSFIQNSRNEGNGSNSFPSIYSDCNSSKHVRVISPTNLPAQFSKEYLDNFTSDIKNGDAKIDLSTDYTSLDCQYKSSDCTHSLQTEESGGFSSFSNKYNSIKRYTDSLCTDSNNTKSVQYDISGKLVKSMHSKSAQSNSGIYSDFLAKPYSAHSETSSEFMYPSGFESALLDTEREYASSTQSLFRSCKSNSLGDHFYSAQSELQSQSESSHIIISESKPSPCYSLKESDPIFSDGWSESQFSSLSKSSHSDTKEKDPSSTELISSPTECTEEPDILLSESKKKTCFSTRLESCLSDSLRKHHCSPDLDQCWFSSLREFDHSTQSEASLPDRSGEAVYATPKIFAQCDNKIVSSSFRNCFSPCDQRQSEIQSVISDQLSNKSDKSHDIAFFKITNTNILTKSKVAFVDSDFEIDHETDRFNMAATVLDVHEKSYLIRPEVICEGIQRQINVQNRVCYWHQVMQLYFTLMTALSIGDSLKWLFQLRPVTIQALQELQSILIYPFTNLNEFFSCKSRDLPPGFEECMSVEWMRLQTFQNYPITASGSPIRLAREGFYYTGQGTQTRCFSCGVTHAEWNYFDNPSEVHQRLSPNCPFLNGRQEGHRNIPMSPDGSGNIARADRDSIPPPSFPVAPLPGSGTGQAEGSRSVSREVPRTSKTTDEDGNIGQQQTSGSGETTPSTHFHPVEESAQSEADNRPKFAEHVPLPSRIATYSHGWPPYLDQTPQQMAEAGFFFTGNQDYTRCYQCGGGLRNWEPGDNPWIEHCRWYPTCPHVQKGKGQRFVSAVLKKQAELLSTQRAESRRKAQYGISITDPLETLAAITLLEMGYPRDTVRNSILILRRQQEPGKEITAQEVLDFIWKEEDIERQRQEEEASRPRCPGDAQAPVPPTLMEHLNLGSSPVVTQAAVQQSASITTTTSSLTTVAMVMTSVTMTISSTSGTSSITSTLASASGPTQSTNESGQGQEQDEGQGINTNVGENGNKRGGSMLRNGVSDGSVGEEIAAQNNEGSELGEQKPSGAEGGQSEGPGAHAQSIAAAINEDEDFHSLNSEEMENKDYGELEEENKKLKEQTTCKICMENPIRVIFLPCGHLVCCETCAPAFRKCPICRKRIQQTVNIFL